MPTYADALRELASTLQSAFNDPCEGTDWRAVEIVIGRLRSLTDDLSRDKAKFLQATEEAESSGRGI